jgi:hypothetical protein
MMTLEHAARLLLVVNDDNRWKCQAIHTRYHINNGHLWFTGNDGGTKFSILTGAANPFVVQSSPDLDKTNFIEERFHTARQHDCFCQMSLYGLQKGKFLLLLAFLNSSLLAAGENK